MKDGIGNIGETPLNRFLRFQKLKDDTMKMQSRQFWKMVMTILGIGWGMGTVLGLIMLFRYQTLSCAAGNPVTHWPIDSRIAGDEDGSPLLVMVVHPHCPCTRSSLEALARIMARCQDRVTGRVLFVKPNGVPADWVHTDLWRSAAAIPGIEVVCDDAGLESARLGLKTSGHTLLFDRHGEQVFSGGITAGRGHHGDNAGLDQCIAVLTGQKSDANHTPVYGCPLSDPTVAEIEEGALCRQCK